MKRCPKCNRSYPTDTQRFCTADGGMLVTVEASPAETVLLDSDDDAPTKVISRELIPESARNFDPFKTTVDNAPAGREGTSEMRWRPTRDLSQQSAPPPQPPPAPPQTSAPLPPPVSGPISQPLSEVTSPSIPVAPSQPAAPPPQVSAPLPPAPPQTSAPPPPPQVSAPLPASPPPQTSGSLPPAGSGPVVTSAPLLAPSSAPLPPPQFTGASQPQPVQPLTPPTAKKKSKLPWVLAILVVLFVLVAGVGVAAYMFGPKLVAMIQARRSGASRETPVNQKPSESNTNTAPVEPAKPPAENEPPKTTADNEPAPYAAPADAVQFLNSNKSLDGKLAEHFVDFSFYYPERWQKDLKSGVRGASNFVKVERRLPPDFTQENFAVGWYGSSGSLQSDQDLFHGLAENLSTQLSKNFPGYRKVSEGATKVGVYDGYEFRFEGLSQDTTKGDIKLWGRVVFLPPTNGEKSGITLLMLATSLAPELRGVDDVGKKGELPMLLESFRFEHSASK